MSDVTVACCLLCRHHITISADGVEYGHARGKGIGGDPERCPRRPRSVDPTSHQRGASA